MSNEEIITTWECEHNQANETSTYTFKNGIIVIADHQLHRAYTLKDGEPIEEPMSTLGIDLDSWTSILIGKQRIQ